MNSFSEQQQLFVALLEPMPSASVSKLYSITTGVQMHTYEHASHGW